MKKLISPVTGHVLLADANIPNIHDGEIRVRMLACGICGTDVMKVYDANPDRNFSLGHEIAGVIEESRSPQFMAGQRVAVAHHAPDATSHYTKRGSQTMDPTFKRSNVDPCGFAELIRIPANLVLETVHPIPDGMSLERASFMEPLACCIRAVDRAQVHSGDTVIIVGVGAIGLLFVPLISALGATAIAIDTRAERFEVAASWGAKPLDQLSTLSANRGADAVILTVVNDATLRTAFSHIRDGGRIITFGVKPDTVLALDLWQIYRRELSVLSSYSATPQGLTRALSLLERDDFSLEKTISHRFSLADAAIGFQLLHDAKASKVLIHP